MKLLDLTSDIVFRTLFTTNKESLIDLLNAILGFKGDEIIQEIEILNPEILKEHKKDKVSILDIKARNERGELFNVEMQAFSQNHYPSRSLYYWARLYSGQIEEGDSYAELKKVYSINILNFKLIQNEHYKNDFFILEKKNPSLKLTDNFQMIFLELPKFDKSLSKLEDALDSWLYIIKNTSLLKEKDMHILVEKRPKLKTTFHKLKKLSLREKEFFVNWDREKAELDRISLKEQWYGEGIEKGRDEGKIEGKEEEKIEIARGMLARGMDSDLISDITGLSKKQIESLKRKMDEEKRSKS